MDRGRVGIAVIAAVAIVGALLVLRALGVIARAGPKVELVGDSITFISTGTFTGRLGNDWNVIVSGVSGDRADQRLPDLPGLVAEDPRQVVINLGTNDVLQKKEPAETIVALEKVGAAFGHARCIHLVTISENMTSFTDTGLGSRAAQLNGLIRDLAGRHGWGVVPWAQLVRDYEQGAHPFGPLTTDTVHPTPLGQQILSDAYRKALAAC